MKALLERWAVYQERLSKKEKKKRKTRRIFGVDANDYVGVPANIKALGRGIITDNNPNHDQLGKFDDDKGKGSYSRDGKQTERSGKSLGRSQARCGRLKRQDGHKYRCRDGTLREDELDAPTDIQVAYIKATIENAVKTAVKSALKDASKQTQCSIEQCAKIYNTMNRSEKGKLYDKPTGR